MARIIDSAADRLLSRLVPTAEAQAMAAICVPIISQTVYCSPGSPPGMAQQTKKLCVDFDAKRLWLETVGGCPR